MDADHHQISVRARRASLRPVRFIKRCSCGVAFTSHDRAEASAAADRHLLSVGLTPQVASEHLGKKLKDKTRAATAKAIRDGVLVKRPCEICGNPKVHAHHEDYSNPLDIRWLCSNHHWSRHDDLRSARRQGVSPRTWIAFVERQHGHIATRQQWHAERGAMALGG